MVMETNEDDSTIALDPLLLDHQTPQWPLWNELTCFDVVSSRSAASTQKKKSKLSTWTDPADMDAGTELRPWLFLILSGLLLGNTFSKVHQQIFLDIVFTAGRNLGGHWVRFNVTFQSLTEKPSYLWRWESSVRVPSSFLLCKMSWTWTVPQGAIVPGNLKPVKMQRVPVKRFS